MDMLTIRATNVLAINEYLGDSGAANVFRQCLLNSTSILCTRYHKKNNINKLSLGTPQHLPLILT